jgi:hypothetical protein
MPPPARSAGGPTLPDRVGDLVRDHPFWLSVAAVVALTSLAVAVYTPHYDTNDDVSMHLVAAGLVFGDRPDEHLMYSNVLIGLPLKVLYGAYPALPWYGLYHYATLIAASVAVCFALLKINPTAPGAVAVLLVLVLAVLPCLVGLQFTKTAFLASFAGLLLVLAPLRGAAPWPKAADAAGVALLVLGSLVRFESFLMAFAIAAPVAVAAAIGAPRRALRRAALPGAAAVLAVALNAYNRDYYARSTGWETFYAYNALRANFTDYMRYVYTNESGPAFQAAGWQQVDVDMMRNWFFADPDRYSLGKLQEIVATAPVMPPLPAGVALYAVAINLPRFPDLIELLVAAACPPLLAGGGWRRFALPAVLVVVSVGLTVGLVVFYWLPVRVAFCLFSGALVASAMSPSGRNGAGPSDPAARLARAAGLLLAAALALWSLKGISDKQAEAERHHAAMRQALQTIQPRADQLYVLWRDWFQLEKLVDPFGDTRDLRDFRCVWLSGMLRTPITQRRLHEFGIDDLYRAIYERPDGIRVVAMYNLMQMYRFYVHWHFGVDTAYAVVFAAADYARQNPGVEMPSEFVVYALKEIPPAGVGKGPDGQEKK